MREPPHLKLGLIHRDPQQGPAASKRQNGVVIGRGRGASGACHDATHRVAIFRLPRSPMQQHATFVPLEGQAADPDVSTSRRLQANSNSRSTCPTLAVERKKLLVKPQISHIQLLYCAQWRRNELKDLKPSRLARFNTEASVGAEGVRT